MNKLTKIVLFAALVLCGTSCGGGDDDPIPVTPVTPDPPQYPTFDAPHWQNEAQGVVNKYESTMTAYVTLPDSLSDKAAANDQIAVFCGAECRGYAFYDNDATVWIAMIYGNAGDALTFKYYSTATRHLYNAAATVPFAPDTQYGNPDAPQVLSLNIETQK